MFPVRVYEYSKRHKEMIVSQDPMSRDEFSKKQLNSQNECNIVIDLLNQLSNIKYGNALLIYAVMDFITN